MMTIIILAVLAIGVMSLIGIYNGLVRMRNDVKNAFKQIDVQLKRRYDLIPNLVNSVKGEMKFEQETLEKVMKARAAALEACKGGNVGAIGAAEGQLTGALGKLLAVVEAYPDLKAHENVSSLMEELKTTENKVAFARQFYNDLATKFNTRQQVFPNNLIASAMGFTTSDLFEIENEEERKTVKVDLTL